MERSRLTLGNGSHCGPFSRMRNTLRQTSYVVLVGTWAPVAAIVALRSTFEAMFPALEARTASEGPVLSSLFPTTTVGDNYGALAGGGIVGVSTANNFFSSSSL